MRFLAVALSALAGQSTAQYTAEQPLPAWADRNQDGMTYTPSSTMLDIIGTPCTIDPDSWCSPVTNNALNGLLIKMNVGPFCVTGIAPAMQRLRSAFDALKADNHELWSQFGTAGSICCRRISGSSSFSNHAWGAAIDLTINGDLDDYNDGNDDESEECG